MLQSTFTMKTLNQPLDTLQDIKRMMERSSRFISLSGWSGFSAGICALAGAWLAYWKISQYNAGLIFLMIKQEDIIQAWRGKAW